MKSYIKFFPLCLFLLSSCSSEHLGSYEEQNKLNSKFEGATLVGHKVTLTSGEVLTIKSVKGCYYRISGVKSGLVIKPEDKNCTK